MLEGINMDLSIIKMNGYMIGFMFAMVIINGYFVVSILKNVTKIVPIEISLRELSKMVREFGLDLKIILKESHEQSVRISLTEQKQIELQHRISKLEDYYHAQN